MQPPTLDYHTPGRQQVRRERSILFVQNVIIGTLTLLVFGAIIALGLLSWLTD